MKINIDSQELEAAKSSGDIAFAEWLWHKIATAAGGEINAKNLPKLSAGQVTLWAYFILRDEVLEGGFVQLIANGWGDFFFHNPFAKSLRLWGMEDLAHLVNKAARYQKKTPVPTGALSEDDFMALYERYPAFDKLDDTFVEQEPIFTQAVAEYALTHTEEFLQ